LGGLGGKAPRNKEIWQGLRPYFIYKFYLEIGTKIG